MTTALDEESIMEPDTPPTPSVADAITFPPPGAALGTITHVLIEGLGTFPLPLPDEPVEEGEEGPRERKSGT
jgi:hypothetical protein